MKERTKKGKESDQMVVYGRIRGKKQVERARKLIQATGLNTQTIFETMWSSLLNDGGPIVRAQKEVIEEAVRKLKSDPSFNAPEPQPVGFSV